MKHNEIAQIVSRGYEKHTGQVGEVEYYIEGNVITFRGTEASKLIKGAGFLDVIRDIRAIPWYDERVGMSHAGFLKGARKVVDGELKQFMDNSEHESWIVAGHSLGAAMSLLAAIMLFSDGYKITEWIGFGCPRALIGKRHLPFITTSYKHGNDIVPSVPPRWLFGYRHPYPLVEVGKASEEGDNWTDHDINLYIKAINL